MRGAKRKGVRYFGPYSHAWAIRETVDLLLRVFPTRTCSNGVFKRAGQVGRPCLLGYIGKCSAPCVGRVSAEEHRRSPTTSARSCPARPSGSPGGSRRRCGPRPTRRTTSGPHGCATTSAPLRRAMEKNAVVLGDGTDADVIALAEDPLEAAVQVFHVRGGRVRGQRGFVVERVEELDTGDLVEQLLLQLYGGESGDAVPREVLVPALPTDVASVTEWLAVRRGGPVDLRVPQRGDKRTLMETVARNAEQSLVLHKTARRRPDRAQPRARRGPGRPRAGPGAAAHRVLRPTACDLRVDGAQHGGRRLPDARRSADRRGRAVALGLTATSTRSSSTSSAARPTRSSSRCSRCMWSEHCSYKHSQEAAAHAADRGPARASWARARTRARSTSATAWPARSRSSRTTTRARSSRFQGAATGVGGILRDIFAIGARPIAVLDSLRFGEPPRAALALPARPRVAGIGHYGNSIGVPTVGGEVYFEAPYEQNCLVNAMALGLAEQRPADPQRGGRASATSLVLFGASTGRDGIGGASVLASRRARRGRRGQAPDRPGRRPVRGEEAAGVLARAARARAARLAAGPRRGRADLVARRRWRPRARSGIDLDVAQRAAARGGHGAVRDHGLRVAGADALRRRARARRRGARGLRDSWEVHGDGDRRRSPTRGRMRVSTAASSSATCRSRRSSTTARSTTSRPRAPPAALPGAARATLAAGADAARGAARAAALAEHRLAAAALRAVRLRSCSRARCAGPSEADAAVLRLPDGSGARGRRSTATAGGSPPTPTGHGRRRARVRVEPRLRRAPSRSGTTNYLNFGNPEKPHIAWQLTEAVRGLGDACRALEAPIVGGNVSLYNEGAEGPDLPDAGRRHGRAAARRRARRPARRSRSEGDAVAIVGPRSRRRSAASRAGQAARRAAARRAARVRHRAGASPRRTRSARRCARARSSSAHDIAEGGFASRSPSAAWRAGSARRSTLGPASDAVDATLFGEGPGRLRRLRAARGAIAAGRARAARRLRRRSAATRCDVTIAGDRAGACRSTSCAEAHDALRALLPVAPRRAARRCYAGAEPLLLFARAGPLDDGIEPLSTSATARATSAASSASTRPSTTSPPRLLRAVRAAAPRAGVGGHRRRRPRRLHHHAARARPRQPGLQGARPARARRRAGDRPRPLLDDRLQRVGELAARPPLAGSAATAASSRSPTTAT